MSLTDVQRRPVIIAPARAGMLWIVREGKRWYCESYDIERPDHWFLDLVRWEHIGVPGVASRKI